MNDEQTPSAMDVARIAALEGSGVWTKPEPARFTGLTVCSCDDTFPVGGGCPVHPGAKELDWRRKAHDLHERWSGCARISAVVPQSLAVATPDTP